MKFCTKTREILQYAESINTEMHFNEGRTQRIISNIKNELMTVELEEEIPFKFLINDIRKLNGALSEHKDADVFFFENYIALREGRFEQRIEIDQDKAKPLPKDPNPPENSGWSIEGIFISKSTLARIITAGKNHSASIDSTSIKRKTKRNDPVLEFSSDEEGRLLGFVGVDRENKNNGLLIDIGKGTLEKPLALKCELIPRLKDDYMLDISTAGIVRLSSEKYNAIHYAYLEA